MYRKIHVLLRSIFVLMLIFCMGTDICAQNSKKVKDLKVKKTQLQKDLKKNQQNLNKAGKEVKNGQSYLHYIDKQLEDRISEIKNMETEMGKVENEMTQLRSNISTLEKELSAQKRQYIRTLRFTQQFPDVDNPIIFVLSSKNLTQMYRRLRYAREYALYQHEKGRQILNKQGRLKGAQNSLIATRSKMSNKLHDVKRQRSRLNEKQARQQQYIKNLKKKEDQLRTKVAKQQRELSALNKKIDDLIAYEIDQSRKRAEAEAKRNASAEAKQKAGTATSSQTAPSSSKTSTSWLTAADQKLNGTFAQNKGRLPIPITGQYRITGKFGQYNVPGLKNVTLENKGVNYVGRSGARARCVFDGEVTAIFQFSGSKNVLVRHGSYISVYCNLSSVIVKKGQKLKAKDIIGTVLADESGECILHFQLRKETTKLNPEVWIGR